MAVKKARERPQPGRCAHAGKPDTMSAIKPDDDTFYSAPTATCEQSIERASSQPKKTSSQSTIAHRTADGKWDGFGTNSTACLARDNEFRLVISGTTLEFRPEVAGGKPWRRHGAGSEEVGVKWVRTGGGSGVFGERRGRFQHAQSLPAHRHIWVQHAARFDDGLGWVEISFRRTFKASDGLGQFAVLLTLLWQCGYQMLRPS
jgi:hypothetical protein